MLGFRVFLPIAVVSILGACGSSSGGGASTSSGTAVMFDASADLQSSDHFFDFPYPSDLRLTASGAPDLTGIANPTMTPIFEGLRQIAMDRAGFPLMPVAYFRFDAPIAPQDVSNVIAADKSSPILLLDLDQNGALVPTFASIPPADAYVPANVLAITARPGFILMPKHKHAFVVMRSLGDATGAPLGVAPELAALETASASSSPAAALYAPLWSALQTLDVKVSDVAAATVFTTGDVVADTFALSEKVLSAYSVSITNPVIDPNGGAALDRICEVGAQVTYPQFQVGTIPYDTDGLFMIGPDGAPVKQGDETVPVTITLPKMAMPAGGFPLVVYFHGTGGVSTAIVDRGTWHYETNAANCPDMELDSWNGMTGCNTRGTGPGYVVAEHGIAMAASALPLNPQRWPAGANLPLPEYLNINNVASLRDNFRQGILEQRLFFAALQTLTIDPSVVSACEGLSLPAGETAYHFVPRLAQGQSMGAMYANLISAVEPGIQATVATGAGGYWSYFILQSQYLANVPGDLGLLLDIHQDFTYMHPTMMVAQTGLEPADPMSYMPRIGFNPLPTHPTRPIYQPVGLGDSYFTTNIQNAVAMAYENKESGDMVWPTMQPALTLEGLGGMVPYAVTNERSSITAAPYTGVVVQYMGDGIYDPHAIYSQLDAVKYQYGCFFDSFLRSGHATVPAPAALGTPCPAP
jgi:hypothetical protein